MTEETEAHMSNGTAFLGKLLSDRGLTQTSFLCTQNSLCALKVIQGVNFTFFFFQNHLTVDSFLSHTSLIILYLAVI